MAGPAHPEAMAPRKPGHTRTAPPQMPSSWWSAPRIRTYLLFDATGITYFLLAFIALRVVLELGDGPEAWAEVQANLTHPLYILFHIVGLVSVVFVGVRFFKLFPKAQPSRLGPAKPPPQPVIQAMLYGVWIAVSLGMTLILAGVVF